MQRSIRSSSASPCFRSRWRRRPEALQLSAKAKPQISRRRTMGSAWHGPSKARHRPAKPAPPPAQAAPPQGGRVKALPPARPWTIGGNDVGNAAVKGAVVGGVAQRNRHGAAAAGAAQSQQAGQQNMGHLLQTRMAPA